MSSTREGGCACGAVRYRLASDPLFVHCCRCMNCQRQTGSAFVIDLLIRPTESSSSPVNRAGRRASDRRQEAEDLALSDVPGRGLRRTRGRQVRFVRGGTLDDPAAVAPDVHIFTRSKLPWVALPDSVPAFAVYYDTKKLWPTASLERFEALAASAAQKPEDPRESQQLETVVMMIDCERPRASTRQVVSGRPRRVTTSSSNRLTTTQAWLDDAHTLAELAVLACERHVGVLFVELQDHRVRRLEHEAESWIRAGVRCQRLGTRVEDGPIRRRTTDDRGVHRERDVIESCRPGGDCRAVVEGVDAGAVLGHRRAGACRSPRSRASRRNDRWLKTACPSAVDGRREEAEEPSLARGT